MFSGDAILIVLQNDEKNIKKYYYLKIICTFAKITMHMFQRQLFPELLNALKVKQIIAITGMRRVGKTTSLRYLLSKVADTNKVYFDLERVEHRMLFRQENYGNIVQGLEYEGLDLSRKAWIAIDEVQLVPEIASVIKFLYDTYDIKFFISGSSSYYLKNLFSESLAGRKRVYELWPLSFYEFLQFTQSRDAFLVEEPYVPYSFVISGKLRDAYKEYLLYGGFPEVVFESLRSHKQHLLRDIINSYLNLDIQILADFRRVDDIYKVIRLLAGRVGSKTDFVKISSICGINRQLLREYILFFEQTYLIRQVPAFVTNADREIALQKKLYFSDNGILNTLAEVGSGAVLENSVANQLSLRGALKYYARRSGQEIDFILDDKIAFEVKETPSPADLRTLQKRAEQIGIAESYLVGYQLLNKEFTGFVWAGNV